MTRRSCRPTKLETGPELSHLCRPDVGTGASQVQSSTPLPFRRRRRCAAVPLTPIRFIPVARGGCGVGPAAVAPVSSQCGRSRHAGTAPGLHIKRKHSRAAPVNTTILEAFAARAAERGNDVTGGWLLTWQRVVEMLSHMTSRHQWQPAGSPCGSHAGL